MTTTAEPRTGSIAGTDAGAGAGAGTGRVVALPALAHQHSGHTVGWWGVVALVASEGMLFALLLFGNFYLRANAGVWPLGGIAEPELAKSGARTVVLLGSTLPAVVAERAAKRHDKALTIAALSLTALMGCVFLVGHGEEYINLWSEFTPYTNAYGSVFYTITALHAIHVMIGVLALGFLVWRIGAEGRFTERHDANVGVGVFYWHFVDVVWVAVYSSLYLSVSL